MKNEELKKLELSDEQIKAVQKIHGLDIEAKKSEIETLKVESETLTTEGKKLTKQLAEFEKTIKGLKDVDEEGLQKAIDDLQTKSDDLKSELKQSKADAKTEIDKFKFDSALKKTLEDDYGAKDAQDIIHRLKYDDIKLTDEGFVGLKEQITPLKEKVDYLFTAEEETKPKFSTKLKSKSIVGDALTDSIMEGAGLKLTEG